MIFITGDTHRDFRRVEYLCEAYKTTKKDTLIILGDVGINYFGDYSDIQAKEYLSNLNITLLCIKGNHENYAGNISSYTLTKYRGGKAYIEYDYPNLIFAKDGEIYDFDGKKCIAVGGAYSVDKYYRLAAGTNWFKDEQPSEKTKKFVESQLDKVDWHIDVILSHTCALRYMPVEWFLSDIDQATVDNDTEEWLDLIEAKAYYNKWYCGHFHGEKTIDKMRFMFQDIVEFR